MRQLLFMLMMAANLPQRAQTFVRKIIIQPRKASRTQNDDVGHPMTKSGGFQETTDHFRSKTLFKGIMPSKLAAETVSLPHTQTDKS